MTPFKQPELAWTVSAVVPYDEGWSKNGMWAWDQGNHRPRLTGGARARRTRLAEAIRMQLEPGQVKRRPLWVSIHVAKPDHNTDAVNVVDVVCDAVEEATGLDDRWFCLGSVTWEVSKTHAEMEVVCGQEIGGDVILCCSCGLQLDPEQFTRDATGPLGRSRACRSCQRRGRERSAEAKRRRYRRDAPPGFPDPKQPPPWAGVR